MCKLTSVLTGDLIRSSVAGAETTETTIRSIAHAARSIERWNSNAPAKFTRHRGDGWQFMIQSPQYALRAALFIRALLRADANLLDTRIAIGQGTIDSLGSRDLSDAHGPAFVYSGQTLDGMSRMSLISLAGTAVTGFQQIIVSLLAERSTRWTREQAAAMVHYLDPDNPTLNDIAPRLGISPQAVNYRLKGAAATEIRKALRDWEHAYEEMDSTTTTNMPLCKHDPAGTDHQ
jgi:hypothetical protein